MRTRTKVWLMIAASLVLVGCILFAGVMASINWDFKELATVKYETSTYEISETFDSIFVNTDTTDIVFVVSDNDKCRVECHEEANAKHSVNVKDGTLTIELMEERSLYDSIGYIGLNFGSPQITVYLPKTEYTTLLVKGTTSDVEITSDFMFQDVDISLSTGDIHLENISVDSLDLTVSTGRVTAANITCEGDITIIVSTGDVNLTDIACKSIISSGGTGGISLDKVIAAEKFSFERSTGNVNFNRCDAAEIYVKTGTGGVTGTLLTDKVFITQTNTGSVDVPKTVEGGICEVTTNTGDINLEVQ